MVLAYVLIETKPSKEHEVYDELKKYPCITDLHPLCLGEHNIIAKIEAKNYDNIANHINSIRKIPEVTDTKSLFGLKR